MKSASYLGLVAVLSLVGHRTVDAEEDLAGRAGALLAAGRAAEAEAAARACGAPECALVLGRALFAQHRLGEAASVLHHARPLLGPLAAHAEVLEGESLLLSGYARDAAESLAAAAMAEGPPARRAAALLADARLAAGDFAEAIQQAARAAAIPGQPPDVQAGLAWTTAQAFLGEARRDLERSTQAAESLRNFWLRYPEHPASEMARAAERDLGVGLPEPSGRDLLLRASRLLASGHPAAAQAQADVAANMLTGEDRADAKLLYARALAAGGKRSEAGPSLQEAWADGSAQEAAPAGMLLARDRARRDLDAEAIRIADAVAKKYPASPEAEESVLFVARLLSDAGKRPQARARLAKLAATRSGPNASVARWMLAWMSWQDHLRDAPERFAEYAASATDDDGRAMGVYWQARSGRTKAAPALYRRAGELDPLGWYGMLARARLGQIASGEPPFPPARSEIASALPARLALGVRLAQLGLLSEASAEADWFVQRHPGDAGMAALPLYERAGRPDRALLLAEALLGGRGPRAPRAVLEAAYPLAFPAEVGRAAQRTGLDPYLLLAVMRRESLFKPDTRSVAGAVGLLQLLPATARRAAVVLGRPPLRDEELVEPATAIDLGAWYLSELVGRFGDAAVALAAYNAGPRVAAPWATRGSGHQLDEWVEDIPYRETRRYIKAVAGAWSAYRVLAGGAPPSLAATVPPLKSGANF